MIGFIIMLALIGYYYGITGLLIAIAASILVAKL